MMSGLSSVLLAFREHFTLAAVLIAVSIIMDIADGGVARLVGATSPFGLQMDSLADLISFGFAPAILVHTWALPDYPILSWLAAFFWLGCAAFRLARFNVTVDPTADKRYFVGLPSPAAAAVVMATIFALNQPEAGGYDASLIVPIVISVVPGRAHGHLDPVPVLPQPARSPTARPPGPPRRSARSRSSSGSCSTRASPVSSSPTATSSRRRSGCSRRRCASGCSGPTRWPRGGSGCRRSSCPDADPDDDDDETADVAR